MRARRNRDQLEYEIDAAAPTVLREIAAGLVPESRTFPFLPDFASEAIVGNVRGKSFQIRRRQPFALTYAPYLVGQVEAQGSGALVRAHFQRHALVRLGIGLRYGAVAIVTLGMAISAIVAPEASRSQWETAALVLIGVFVVMAIVERTIMRASTDKAILQDRLERSLARASANE